MSDDLDTSTLIRYRRFRTLYHHLLMLCAPLLLVVWSIHKMTRMTMLYEQDMEGWRVRLIVDYIPDQAMHANSDEQHICTSLAQRFAKYMPNPRSFEEDTPLQFVN